MRERKEDMMPFIDDYFKRHRDSFGSTIQGLSEEVQEIFLKYDWPGNLKELEVLLDEITSLITNETVVESHMLPVHFKWKIQSTCEETENEVSTSDLFVIKKSARHSTIRCLHERGGGILYFQGFRLSSR
ncbi:hypothetical protein OL548_09575 [Lysinibacillus sp. MHQ-1]|nr:hypothetical protein OL548_09575 [Lysinibacillus sp. MHQ-1]